MECVGMSYIMYRLFSLCVTFITIIHKFTFYWNLFRKCHHKFLRTERERVRCTPYSSGAPYKSYCYYYYWCVIFFLFFDTQRQIQHFCYCRYWWRAFLLLLLFQLILVQLRFEWMNDLRRCIGRYWMRILCSRMQNRAFINIFDCENTLAACAMRCVCECVCTPHSGWIPPECVHE